MNLIIDNMQWIMLVSGLLTLTLLQGVFAPRAVMQSMFGESIESEATNLLMRNWSALVAAGGALLIYAAFNPEWRPLVLIFVGAGKLVFIALVLLRSGVFLKRQAGLAIVLDSIMVILFALYLFGSGAT